MKRHPVLQDLSRDHFFALQQAQRLRRATAETLDAVANEFLDFWRRQMVRHFREEEEVLLPVFTRYRSTTDPVVVAVLVQHVDIARSAIDLDSSERTIPTAHDLGDLIDRHVRHEEEHLFPLVEKALSESDLTRLGDLLTAFARRAGP